MQDLQVGRTFRLLRIRKGWRQADASVRSGLSRKTIRKIEQGFVDAISLAAIRRYAATFELRVDLSVIGRGGELARTLDEEHAAIVEHLAALLTASGWIVEPEASFNHYGDRGRIDLLAFHPVTRTLLIVEVKTVLTDLQEMFGSMNVKQRLAPQLARERGWEVSEVASLLAVASTSASRQIVRQHRTLFGPMTADAARIRRWITTPNGPAAANGAAAMLLWVPAAQLGKRTWIAGRRRVRTGRVGRDLGRES